MSAEHTIIVPAFNEAATIRAVVDELAAAHPAAELLVIDDGSQDGTAAALDGSRRAW